MKTIKENMPSHKQLTLLQKKKKKAWQKTNIHKIIQPACVLVWEFSV